MYKAIMIIIELSGLFFLVKIYSGYPKTVLQQEYKKALFTFFMAFLYLSISLSTIIIWFNRPIKEALIISASIFWGIMFLIFIILWIQSKQKSGRVLLDIQSIPNKLAFVALAIYFIVVGFGSALSYFLATHYGLYTAILFWASFITWSLVMATSRLQICDKGFMVYCLLRRWEKN